MTLEEWERTVHPGVRGDALWKRQDYRLASYLADTAWADVEQLGRHPAMRDVSPQLYEALGSIPSHISEGYSRGTSADRVKYLEYALGSSREAREWYRRGQPVLGPARVTERLDLLTSVIRLLLTAIPSERASRTPRFRTAAPPRGRRSRGFDEGPGDEG
jgi:four helix bundle protein